MVEHINNKVRKATKTIATHNANYLIPKGWRVMVVHTTFHLDAQNYPSPNKFDHNRFEVSLQYNLLILLFTLDVD